MKKDYIQPQMAQMPVTPQTIVCVSVVTTPQDNVVSEAPFRGQTQGLKYMI